MSKQSTFERDLAFQILASGLPKPVTQYPFAESMGRKFKADFAWPEAKLLVEVIGGIWQKGGGGHSHPMHIVKDIERQQHAVLLGWFVLPVTTDQVKNGEALTLVESALENAQIRQMPRYVIDPMTSVIKSLP
jgi:very-short-patch-repair endonuclease